MKLLSAIILIFLSKTIVNSQKTYSDQLWDTYYNDCRHKLGTPKLICPENDCRHNLSNPKLICPESKLKSQETVNQIDDLLWRLQADVPCYCSDPNDCYRYGNITIQSGVMGALIVTEHMPPEPYAVSKRIYDDAGLAASESCDNGILVVYGTEDKKLYVLRGNATEQVIFDSDTVTETVQQDALPQILQQYLARLQGDNYERQRNWEAMVGVVVAVVIVAFAAAVLIGIFAARYCGKKKSLTRPPPPPLFKKQQERVKTALRRVKRKQTRAAAKQQKAKVISGKPVTPKRLAAAQRRLKRKENKKQRKIFEEQQRQQQQQRALLTPSSGSEEQYYLISEPSSTIYAPYAAQTTIRAGANGTSAGAGAESPYASGTLRPSSSAGYQPPAIMYTDSQATFNHPSSPRRETQRRDTYVYDEEGKEIYDSPTR